MVASSSVQSIQNVLGVLSVFLDLWLEELKLLNFSCTVAFLEWVSSRFRVENVRSDKSNST